MAHECARQLLKTRFDTWLRTKYSEDNLKYVDIKEEEKAWVAEQGEFIVGTGLCIWAKCLICGQYPKVLESGVMSKLMSEPVCHRAPRTGLIHVSEFSG